MSSVETIAKIASVVKAAVDLTPNVIQTVQDATPFAQMIYQIVSGKEITKEDLDDLEAKLTDLSNQLQLPIDGE